LFKSLTFWHAKKTIPYQERSSNLLQRITEDKYNKFPCKVAYQGVLLPTVVRKAQQEASKQALVFRTNPNFFG